MADKPDLILCLAINYSLEAIEPFLASWREYARKAELAMFSMNMGEGFDEAAHRMGIRRLDPHQGLSLGYHPQTARYFMYRDFLSAHRNDYAAVLLTDVRDVVFQGDPFAAPRAAPVSFAAEDQVIGACRWNTGWIEQTYGQETAADFAGRLISCSGTTIGDAAAILDYLDLLCGEAEAHPEVAGTPGVDQGLHNYILWRLAPDFINLDLADRIVNTIGHTPADEVTIADGRISARGSASPVIHQWDRHAKVEAGVRERYRLETAMAIAAEQAA